MHLPYNQIRSPNTTRHRNSHNGAHFQTRPWIPKPQIFNIRSLTSATSSILPKFAHGVDPGHLDRPALADRFSPLMAHGGAINWRVCKFFFWRISYLMSLPGTQYIVNFNLFLKQYKIRAQRQARNLNFEYTGRTTQTEKTNGSRGRNKRKSHQWTYSWTIIYLVKSNSRIIL